MIYTAIGLLALAAVFGLVILLKWISKQDAPRAVVYSHGIVAAGGLGILVAYAFMHPDKFPTVTIGLLTASALVGFYMFFNDLKKKMTPLAIALVHALVAVTGFVTLLIFAFA
ncbi:MAG TPA: hypothetical protein VK809_04215 [Bacteroidia bacterium]|jgi:hypothetical protein|nr:hypothetical protein [Bacteroidia bacterium]